MGDIYLLKRREVVVTDIVNKGSHGETSKNSSARRFWDLASRQESMTLDLDFSQVEN